MPLGLGLSFVFRRIGGGGSIFSPLFNRVKTLIDADGGQYDEACLRTQLNQYYIDDASTPYTLFRHTYDTIEIDGGQADRYCLHAQMNMYSSAYYDAFYREVVGDARRESNAAGFDIIEKSYDTNEVELARFNPDQAFYQAVNAFDDNGRWYRITEMKAVAEAAGFDVIDTKTLIDLYDSYES